MNKKILTLLTILCTSLMMWSCGFEDQKLSQYNLQGATPLPIAKIEISDSMLMSMLGDIAADITPNSDGVLNFSVLNSVEPISKTLRDSMWRVPSQNIYFDVDLKQIISKLKKDGEINDNQLITLPEGVCVELPLDFTRNKYLSDKNIRIDNATFNAGILLLDITSDQKYNLSGLNYCIEQLTDTVGNPAVLQTSQAFMLKENYKLSPNHKVKEKSYSNIISLTISGNVPYGAIKDGVLSGTLGVALGSVQSIEGYLGEQDIAKTRKISYNVSPDFAKFSEMSGYIYFANPTLEIEVENQYNVPIEVDINKLYISNDTINLKSNENRIFIEPLSTTTHTISNSSTISENQLSELISTNFTGYELEVNVRLNQQESNSTKEDTVNSIDATDKVKINCGLTIPLELILQEATFAKDLDVELELYDNTDYIIIKELMFGFMGSNAMPFDFTLTLYMNDDNGNKIEILESPITIEASQSVNQLFTMPYTIDASNIIIKKVKAELLEEIKNCSDFSVSITASTKNAQIGNPDTAVKIYENNSLELIVMVGSKMEIELDSFEI